MNEPERTSPLPQTAAAMRQLQAWQDLREQMQTLHAELEYLRLMLKLQPQPQPPSHP